MDKPAILKLVDDLKFAHGLHQQLPKPHQPSRVTSPSLKADTNVGTCDPVSRTRTRGQAPPRWHRVRGPLSAKQIADAWELSTAKVRRIFQNEPGVIRIGEPSRRLGRKLKRRYFTLRIPQSVVERVHARLRQSSLAPPETRKARELANSRAFCCLLKLFAKVLNVACFAPRPVVLKSIVVSTCPSCFATTSGFRPFSSSPTANVVPKHLHGSAGRDRFALGVECWCAITPHELDITNLSPIRSASRFCATSCERPTPASCPCSGTGDLTSRSALPVCCAVYRRAHDL